MASNTSSSRVGLRVAEPPPAPELDDVQQQVADRLPGRGHLLVTGAPGTGKTTTAMATLLNHLADPGAWPPVLLTPSRRAADRILQQLGPRLSEAQRHARRSQQAGRMLVRTPASFAYSLLRLRAIRHQQPAPTLITGADQDAILAELLAGHGQGLGTDPGWPAGIGPETLAHDAFRAELRNLLTRAVELGLSPAQLDDRGQRFARPEWRAAAVVLAEYIDVTALGDTPATRGARYDTAAIVDVATQALRHWGEASGAQDRPRWGTVIVEDYQDATLATARLLSALADNGSELVLLGNADAAVQGFRGAMPSLVARATTAAPIGGFEAEEIVLPKVWRAGPELVDLTRHIAAHVPVLGGARHRHATAVPHELDAEEGPVQATATVLAGASQEAAFLARQLREEHLNHATPWHEMAVIVRSSSQAEVLRRMLRELEVPVTDDGPRPLHAEPAVRPLLLAMSAVARHELTPEVAAELLCSPLGGMDSVALRALRRELRPPEPAAPAAVRAATDEILLAALAEEEAAAGLPPEHRRGPQRLARVLGAGRAAATGRGDAHEVLWALWEASGLGREWQRRALAGGGTGQRADADLDAVLALFRAAEQFDERQPGAGAAAFVEETLAQRIASDTLAARGQRDATVAIRTPAATDGAQWEVVAVAGLQDEVWPDVRLRDSLLGTGDLLDVETDRLTDHGDGEQDRGTARRAVLGDELRMLLVAISRARRRLVVTAVADTDTRPSSFFELVAAQLNAPVAGDDGEAWQATKAPRGLDLRGLVAELRAELDDPSGSDQAEAAELLGELARHGVSGADPDEWHGLQEPSSTVPLSQPGAQVPVSPSSVERAATCPLRWMLERAGGQGEDSDVQSLGILVHDIAASHPKGSVSELEEALGEQWHTMGAGEGWVGRHARQQAEQLIARLGAYIATVPGEVETEVKIRADVGRARLGGRIDRIEHLDDGQVRVVDLKTSKGPISPAAAEENPQLAAYQVAVEASALHRGTSSAGARLVYLGTGTGVPIQRQQPDLRDEEASAWATELITEAAEVMAAARFVARENEGCATCPVRSSCPLQAEGRRVTQ